jgi:hypothetical protein
MSKSSFFHGHPHLLSGSLREVFDPVTISVFGMAFEEHGMDTGIV